MTYTVQNKYIKVLFVFLMTIYYSNAMTQELIEYKDIKEKIFEYFDGNGNKYTITSDSIFYEPIPKHTSSSGTFDNGESAENILNLEDFKKIKLYIKELFQKKELHINKRIKTSSVIKYYKNNELEKKVIIKQCIALEKFEQNLKSLID